MFDPDMYELPQATDRLRALAGSVDERANSESAGPVEWRALFEVLYRRRRILTGVAAAAMFLIVVATLLAPSHYTATVKLLAGLPGSNSTDVGAPPGAANDSGLPVLNALMIASGVQSTETFAELIKEVPVAERVIETLKLHTTPEALLSDVKVQPVTNTSILAISVRAQGRNEAASIANQFASVFVDRERDIVASQATAAIAFLSSELPGAADRLTKAQTDLASYEQQHEIADIDEQTKERLATISAMDSKIAQLGVDKKQALAAIGTIGGQIAANPTTIAGQLNVAPNPILQQLKAQLAQLTVQIRSASAQYTDHHPTMIALKQQYADLEREIASQPASITSGISTVPNPLFQQLSQQVANLRAQVSSDDAQIAALTAQRAAQIPHLKSLPFEAMQLSKLKRTAQSAESVFTALQRKYDDATVAKSTALSNVTVTEPATAAFAIRSPNILLNVAVGLVVSLVLGLLAVLLAELFDDTIKSESDLERRLAIPVLATIPQFDSDKRRALPWIRQLTVESFLQLISSMAYSSAQPLHTIAISSPSEGDGKTTIAANVGIAMADLGPQVLLIDADMRRPRLHERLLLANELGLSDVLVGAASLEEAVRKTEHPGLDCLTSGMSSPNPIKLLQSEKFAELLKEAGRRYRAIIIDSPALNAVFDANIITAASDAFVLVVAANKTDLRSVDRAVKRLHMTGIGNLLGVVLNMTPVAHIAYGSGYYLASADRAELVSSPTSL